MTPPKIRFGVTLPQHQASWEEARSIAMLCEAVGFDSLWAVDHLFSIPNPEDSLLEGWTEITAIAALTDRIQIGHLVLCMNYRHPALLAKMAATLDQISGGRFILGTGCGWHAEEAQAYGIPFPPVRTRLAQLDEGLSLIKSMWQEAPAEYFGEQFQIENAYCLPTPLQKPHPPILVGGGGEKVLLRIVATHAQIWNNLGIDQPHLARKTGILQGHCDSLGRDFQEIEISQQTTAAIGATEAEAREAKEKILADLPFLGGGEDWIIAGTAEQCIERVQKTVDAGARTLLLNFGRNPSPETLQMFAETVIPAFR